MHVTVVPVLGTLMVRQVHSSGIQKSHVLKEDMCSEDAEVNTSSETVPVSLKKRGLSAARVFIHGVVKINASTGRRFVSTLCANQPTNDFVTLTFVCAFSSSPDLNCFAAQGLQ